MNVLLTGGYLLIDITEYMTRFSNVLRLEITDTMTMIFYSYMVIDGSFTSSSKEPLYELRYFYFHQDYQLSHGSSLSDSQQRDLPRVEQTSWP